MPALGVTCVRWMCDLLADAGADRFILLPDETADLVTWFNEIQKQSNR
jgi:hypothetical protein